MPTAQQPSGEHRGRSAPGVAGPRTMTASRVPQHPEARGRSERLVLGAVTVSVHEHRAGMDRTSGVAAGRMRLLIVHGGAVQIPARDGVHEIGDGQGVLVTGTASVRMSSSSGGEVITVGLPMDALPQLTLPKNSAILIEDTALLRPIGAFVHTLHGGERLDVLSRGYFARILCDMIMVVLRRATEVVAAPAPSLHQRAMASLQRRYSEADLTPATIAAEMNLSLRQLEREFTPTGRTIRQEIRRVRVSAAAAILRDRNQAAQSIDEVSARVGLSNGSSLARAMAAEGMPSPAKLRSVPGVAPVGPHT